jgi:hypothetical protein
LKEATMRWLLWIELFGFGLLVTEANAETVCGPNGCYQRRHDDYRWRDRYDDRRLRYDDRRHHRPRRCAYVGGVKVCQ